MSHRPGVITIFIIVDYKYTIRVKIRKITSVVGLFHDMIMNINMSTPLIKVLNMRIGNITHKLFTKTLFNLRLIQMLTITFVYFKF